MLPAEPVSSTVKRRHGNDPTWLSRWSRSNPKLDSHKFSLSFTDLDTMVSRLLNGKQHWMLLEQKTFMAIPERQQWPDFKRLHARIRNDDPNAPYHGFHLLQLKTADGTDGLFLDGQEISVQDLESFVLFEKPDDWYRTTWKTR